LLVPLPLVLIEPGPALDVPSRLTLQRSAGPVHGKLLLTSVTFSEPSAVAALDGWLSSHEELVRKENVIPAGVNESDYFRAQEQVFAESARVASAVGLKAAGFPVTVSGGGAEVVEVIRDSPADGHMRTGDVITAINGKPARLATDVTSAVAGAHSGQKVTLTVDRGGTTQTLKLTVRRVSSIGRPALGVALQSVDPKIDLPFAVKVNQGDIGGPSAGLMLALSVYDLASATDLARGRVIAGTGTIDLDGRVGEIGGIAEKVVGARRAGAMLFLAPATQAGDARKAAGGRIRVVAVKTFQDAVDARGGG